MKNFLAVTFILLAATLGFGQAGNTHFNPTATAQVGHGHQSQANVHWNDIVHLKFRH